MMLRLVVIAVIAVLSCYAEEQTNARILASKSIRNTYLVEGRDITIEYSIYNIGASAATSVELDDDKYDESSFEVTQGLLKVRWDRIAPGSNVTHSVILRPVKSGFFNFTAGVITYMASEDAKDPTYVYTSAPGNGQIVGYREYDRMYSPHILDWTVFAVMCIPSLAIPYMLWYGSKSKYDVDKAKKKN